jgi:hypothetical protein
MAGTEDKALVEQCVRVREATYDLIEAAQGLYVVTEDLEQRTRYLAGDD